MSPSPTAGAFFNMAERTRIGVERLLNEKLDLLTGQRIGLVFNQASVLPALRFVADVFAVRDDINLTAYLGPEHGIRGDVQDNMVETDDSTDPRFSVPVY